MKIAFADCVLDDEAFTLERNGVAVDVEPQVFDLLLALARAPGVVLSRDDLIEAVWGGRIVSDSAISARISAARRAVGDDGKEQRVIRTLPRRGFQFVAEVKGGSAKAAPASTGQRIRYATADDGVKIAYAVTGSGPPLFRVAHHPTHLELDWAEDTERQFFDRLGQHFTFIRLDQRGCGLSDIDVDDFSTERSARDIIAIADAMGIDRFSIYGSSSGGMIAVECAALFPERVIRLATLGGYAEGRSVRNGGDGDDTILRMATEGWNTPDSAFISGYMSVYFPDASPEKLARIAKNAQMSCPVENEIAGRTFFNNHSVVDLLDKIKAPALIMHCRGDAVHPLEQGMKIARGIKDAELMVLESRNHYPMPGEAAWEVMVTSLLAFLES